MRKRAKRFLSLLLGCAVFAVTVLENPMPVMADEEGQIVDLGVTVVTEESTEEEFALNGTDGDANMQRPVGRAEIQGIEVDSVSEDDIVLDVDEMYEEYEEELAADPELTVEDFFVSYVEEVNENAKNSDDDSELEFYEEAAEEFYDEWTEELILEEVLCDETYDEVYEESYDEVLKEVSEENYVEFPEETYEEINEEVYEDAYLESYEDEYVEDAEFELDSDSEDEMILEAYEESYEEPYEKPYVEEYLEAEDDEFELCSEIYNHEWDRYSSNYVYNRLNDKQKLFWNSLDSVALSALTGTQTLGAHAKYINYSGRDAVDLLMIFGYENPQYYFIDNYYWWSGKSYTFGIYKEFRNGKSRKEATAKFEQAIAEFKQDVEDTITPGSSSEYDIAVAVQDVICDRVWYDQKCNNTSPYYDEDWYETHIGWYQSCYSAFVGGETVCQGYAEATCLLCNYYNLDCIVVTSLNHAWNQVSIDDRWYNMDTTWDDSENGGWGYYYFLKSDATYSVNYAHCPEGMWQNTYVGKLSAECNNSSNSYTSPDKPEAPTQKVADPRVETDIKNGAVWVRLSCKTPGATIYYNLDGRKASDAYSRCTRYTGEFRINNLEELSNLNAIAVKDGYLNSGNIKFISYLTYKGNKVTGLSEEGRKQEEIEVPAGATSIEAEAFKGENSILAIEIPETVTSIGARAFENCENIQGIEFENSATVKSIGANAFKNINPSCKIGVMGGSMLEKYLKSNGLTGNVCAKYTIAYKLNGGINNINNPGYYVSNNGNSKDFYAPERQGYDFAGWYTNSKFKAGTQITSTEGRCSNLVLYAKWTPIPYSINYYSDGATKEAVNPATYNITKAVMLKNPSKTGFGFLGWFKDSGFSGSKITQIKKGSTGDVDLYAKWQEYSYTVSYNANGGKGYFAPETHLYTEEFDLPDNASETMTRKGYIFLGWSSAKNTSKKGARIFPIGDDSYKAVSKLSDKKNGKITLYAIWMPISYNIIYNLKDTSEHRAQNSSKNSDTYTIAASRKLYAPTRTGYTFGGWFAKDPASPDFNPKIDKKVSSIKKGSTEAKEFYAKWTVNKYTVKFSANGGKGRMSDLKGLAYDETYILPANTFTKGNYTFAGWNTSSKGTGTSISDCSEISGLVSKNGGKITLYAMWE